MVNTVVKGSVSDHRDARSNALVHDRIAVFFHEVLHAVNTIKLVDMLRPVYEEFGEPLVADVHIVLRDSDHLLSSFIDLLPSPLSTSIVLVEHGHALSISNETLAQGHDLLLELVSVLLIYHRTLPSLEI